MQEIKTKDAVGMVLSHDITQIIKGQFKDVRFKKGHIIRQEDVEILLDIGKEHVYVWEEKEGMLHENDAAEIIARLFLGENMSKSEPKEGKIDIFAEVDGLFVVDVERLKSFNGVGEMMAATRFSLEPVKKGDKLVGTRVIPLVIEGKKLDNAAQLVGREPMVKILPFKPLKVGIITTGSEVATGRIKDTFSPVLKEKVEGYGCRVIAHTVVGDNKENITAAISQQKEAGAQLILCSGGMSVDPDDRTPGAIKDSGAEIVTYGAPMLPGAMFLLGYYENGTVVMGVSGCAMYNDITILDVILPRVLAGIKLTREEFAALGHGGLCLKCEDCRWPVCPFGKGR